MLWPILSMVFAGMIIFIAYKSPSIFQVGGFGGFIIMVSTLIILGVIIKKYIINKFDPSMKGFKGNNDKAKKNEPSLLKKIMVGEKRTKEIKENLSNVIKDSSATILDNKNVKEVSNFFKYFGNSNNEENKEENKICPFCAETIKFDAKKCRYCGEWIVKKD